jgi:hypothetical protein
LKLALAVPGHETNGSGTAVERPVTS